MNKFFLGFYCLFLLACLLFSYLFVDPGLFYLHILFTNFSQQNRLVTTILFIIMLLGFFSFYSFILWKIKQKIFSPKDIQKIIVLTCIFLFLSYPAFLSFDIFNYIATAKVTFFYHENPYIIMPIAFTNDPLLLFMHAANKTALYAPAWILITAIPHFLGQNKFLLTLLNFKLLAVGFYLATTLLLWKMTKNLFQTAFFALNPLVIIETLMSGHNDMTMVFFLLISFNFLFSKKKYKSSLFFALSLGIKYATGILAPLFLLQWIKPIRKELFYFWITLFMYTIFFLSSFREEIYPWYALWFLLPATLIAENNFITWISATFSFSLLFRYIPFMLTGTYFGLTPILKTTFMITPVIIAIIVYIFRKNLHKA